MSTMPCPHIAHGCAGSPCGAIDEHGLHFMPSAGCLVSAELCDALGHMNIQYYARIFSDAGFAIMAALGLGADAIHARRIALMAGRMEIDYLAESRIGARLSCHSAATAAQGRKITFLHRITDDTSGRLVAKARVLSICVDLGTRRSCPIPADICRNVARIGRG